MYEIKTSKSIDEGKVVLSAIQLPNHFEFVGRTREKNGVKGYAVIDGMLPNEANTISISQIGTITAQIRKNKWYASQNIFVLRPMDCRYLSFAFLASINKALSGTFSDGYANYPTLEKLKALSIILPQTADGQIDFAFMNNLVNELEKLHLCRLETYLFSTGLNENKLTSSECQALKNFNDLQWRDFRIGDLFERISTKKLPYKAKDLPQQPTESCSLPCLTSSFMNQGLNYYAPREGATIINNVISIPSNSDVYRAYYQSRDFTVLSDAYAIRWKDDNIELNPKQYLFMVACINQVTDLPIYSYKNKLGGWNVVKDKYITLPVTTDNQPNLFAMEQLVGAMQKIVIADVVKYSAQRIGANSQCQ